MTGLMRRNNFFDDFFTKELFDFNNSGFSNTGITAPSVNVKDTERAFEIQVAAPGMKKDDFNVNLERDILTISSEKQAENEEKDDNGTFSRREFNYSSFQRSFTLPDVVEHENIEATYEDGILKITVPKKETQTQMQKRIEVK
ncbi:Hsp20/alpha crystallin family protein [Kaistella palustris]|uniref:Hsp20/alpha crystallin family protein n=1 Tax=Kaistella palustris TaxID=493376 RepID=UPI00040E04F3|nr:Hsp20/alpha crystallin family protein [Kaistella palustris]